MHGTHKALFVNMLLTGNLNLHLKFWLSNTCDCRCEQAEQAVDTQCRMQPINSVKCQNFTESKRYRDDVNMLLAELQIKSVQLIE